MNDTSFKRRAIAFGAALMMSTIAVSAATSPADHLVQPAAAKVIYA